MFSNCFAKTDGWVRVNENSSPTRRRQSRTTRTLLGLFGLAGLVHCGPTCAMIPATTGSGVEIGLAAGSIRAPGYKTEQLTNFNASYGIKTNNLGFPYTQVFTDGFSVGSPETGSAGLGVLGVIQPVLAASGSTLAVEGGISAFTVNRGLFDTAQTEGLFAGLRASVGSRFQLNAMARNYVVQHGGWQMGLGVTGPISRRLKWQVDYNHFANGKANSVTFGIRWFLPTQHEAGDR